MITFICTALLSLVFFKPKYQQVVALKLLVRLNCESNAL